MKKPRNQIRSRLLQLMSRGLLVLCTSTLLQAQGSLMLAGGGGESKGGWSDLPYQWVVDQALNRRIAVVSYSGGQTAWVPDYFLSLGAHWAKNFMITDRNMADAQSTYDSLITYDGVFLKGGDQSMYFRRFEGTKTQQALQEIFDRGGVLSGTSAGAMILSTVSYTAELSSLSPEFALRDAYSKQHTLAPGLVKSLPVEGIADTHVAERGRFARLSTFLASWYRNENELIKGFGIDDHTALCIDRNALATVYGTGAVGIQTCTELEAPFDTTQKMLSSAPLEFSQLLHGCQLDFKNGTISGLSTYIKPEPPPVQADFTLLFSGTSYPSPEAYDFFTGLFVPDENHVLLVTGQDTERATQVQTELLSRGASSVEIMRATFDQGEDEALAELITSSSSYFLIENQYEDLTRFLNWTSNGLLLKQRISSAGVVTFLAGSDARFAGETVVEGTQDPGYPSYHGELEFKRGLGIIPSSAIISNTFDQSDFIENTVTGIPYAMVQDKLRYGLYLTGNTFVTYGPCENGYPCFHHLGGSYPLVFLENPGTLTGLANQGPHEQSRNIAGFEKMYLRHMGTGEKLFLEQGVSSSTAQNAVQAKIRIYPNPATDWMYIDIQAGFYHLELMDISGNKKLSTRLSGPGRVFPGSLAPGLYLLRISGANIPGGVYSQRVLIVE